MAIQLKSPRCGVFSRGRTFPGFLTAALLAAAAALWASACGGGKHPPDVVIISIDTCRADRLGAWGATSGASPNLDRFAQEAVVFANARTPVPLTLPAHASLLTGLLPATHGVRTNDQYGLAGAWTTLAERLGAAGYRCEAAVGSFVLDEQFGLAAGFDVYDDDLGELPGGGPATERPAGAVTLAALDRLRSATEAGRPFFLFVHYWDPHLPYDPPEEFAARFSDDLYSGEIAYVDENVGLLLETLRRAGLYDDALIVVLGDHGEGLGEHGESDHGFFLYQSTLHVPLIVKPPRLRSRGARAAQPVSLVDVMPTVLDLAGLDAPEYMPGRSLRPLWGGERGRWPERRLVSESLYATRYGCAPLYAVVDGEAKYIDSPRPELYNLVADPAETNDLAGERAGRARGLARFLEGLLDEARSLTREDGAPALAPDALARLRSLGYLGGGALGDESRNSLDRDPKDFIKVHEAVLDTARLETEGRAEDALRVARVVLRRWPDLLEMRKTAGELELGLGRPGAAAEEFRQYLEAVEGAPADDAPPRPAFETASVHAALAEALRALGRGEEAEDHARRARDMTIERLRSALAVSPDSESLRAALDRALREAGNAGSAPK